MCSRGVGFRHSVRLFQFLCSFTVVTGVSQTNVLGQAREGFGKFKTFSHYTPKLIECAALAFSHLMGIGCQTTFNRHLLKPHREVV